MNPGCLKNPGGWCVLFWETHKSALWWGPASIAWFVSILVKNTNGIFWGSEIRRHPSLDSFSLWSSRPSTICEVNHKFGLTSLLKTCRLPTCHRNQSAASHLQAHLPEFNPCPLDGDSVLTGRQLEETQFSYNHSEFLLWCQVTILSCSAHNFIWIRYSSDNPGKPQHARGERFTHAILFHSKKIIKVEKIVIETAVLLSKSFLLSVFGDTIQSWPLWLQSSVPNQRMFSRELIKQIQVPNDNRNIILTG